MPITMYGVTEVAAKTGLHVRIIRRRCAAEKIGCQHAATQEWFLTDQEIERLTRIKRPAGRPATRNWELIDKLILANDPPATIASTCGVSISAVYNRRVKLRKMSVTTTEPAP